MHSLVSIVGNLNLQKIKKEWGTIVLYGLIILIVAVFLRTYNIFSIPIFADEAIYIRWAQVMKAESTLRFLPLSDGKQPLFMWSVIPFLKLINDPLVAGRAVSLFTGLGSLVGIFLLTERLFASRKAALAASLFYAVSPFSVFFDRMALVDSMLAMFGIWSLYFGVLTAQTMRLDMAMLTGFALGGAWLTKSPAIFFVILLPTTALLSSWSKKNKIWHAGKLISLWIVSWLIAFVIYNILRLGPNFHLLSSRNKDYVFELSHAFTNPFDPLQFHLIEIGEWLWVLLPGTVLIAALAGIWWGRKRFWRELLLLLAWILLPLLVQAEFAKVFTARYIFFASLPIFALAAVPLVCAPRLRRAGFWLAAAVIAVPALWFDHLLLTNPEKAPLPRVERSGYLEEWTAGTGIREVADFIREESQKDPDQKIIVGTEGYFGTLPDGLLIYVADIPNVLVKGIGINISSVDSSLIQAKRVGDRVLLVANSSRVYGKPENMGLELLKEYPKVERKENTREFIRYGPRESLYLFEVLDEAVWIFDIKQSEDELD